LVDRSGRMGALLLEVIVALTLLALLVSIGWGFMAKHREVVSAISHRASGLETIRTMAWLLGQETRAGRRGVDWVVGPGDSLPLRAFRGFALIEGDSWVGSRVRVCFRGHRSPAPEKDSVLLLGPDGSWAPLDLVDRVHLSSECRGMLGWEEEEWTLSGGRPGDVVGRLFERGSYHLANGALRYSRGVGGRQPITPENLEEGSFVPPSTEGRGIHWKVTLTGAGEDHGVSLDPNPRTWRGGH
jgi:hypothetical protein